MRRFRLLCLILVVMAVTIAGLQGCTSSTYYRDSESRGLSEKEYSTYDYQGNRLERNEGGSYFLNRGRY
ncbi:MAG: hypothetical protein ACYDHW_16425 [Syntrophorhabdaceae bacterium]